MLSLAVSDVKPFRKIAAGLFGFDRRERRGTYLLSVLLIVLIMVRFTALRPGRVPDDLRPPAAPADSTAGNGADASLSPELFTFDPNTVPYDDLLRLGLTGKQAGTLINYRNSGARFRRPEDLARVYGIDSSTAARLGPYIIIAEDPAGKVSYGSATTPAEGAGRADRYFPEARPADRYSTSSGHGAPAAYSPSSGRGTQSAYSPSSGRGTPAEGAPGESPVVLIDLNRCSAEELESLPGIGPVLSARIIKYRALLGGFVATDQLREVYGLDSSVVSLITPMLTLTFDSVAPLLLDSVSFGDLARHPYVGYETARLISRFRTLTDPPLTLGSMVGNKIISTQQAERLAPYVRPSPGAAGNDYEFISSKVLK